MITKGMMSSSTDDWATSIDLFKELDHEFHFEIDVCANRDNAKCKRFFSIEDDALSKEWTGVCFMNPPYGRSIGKWVKKAAESKALVVCLLPARTDTAWWHDYCIARSKEIRFIRGRLRFNDCGQNAPFPSAIVVFDGRRI